MPSAAAPSGCRKTRLQTWLSSCLFPSCVYDPDDSPPRPVSRTRRRNKSVPLTEETNEAAEGFVAEGGGTKRDISPPANCRKGMPEKIRKIEKRCKLPFICYQPAAAIHTANRRGPVQSRTRTKTIHSGWLGPTRLVGSTQSYPKHDLLIGLKVITMLLMTILIGGKIFAVVITTICFYGFCCVGLSRSPMLVPPTRKNPRI